MVLCTLDSRAAALLDVTELVEGEPAAELEDEVAGRAASVVAA
jgi:hypothetical protein